MSSSSKSPSDQTLSQIKEIMQQILQNGPAFFKKLPAASWQAIKQSPAAVLKFHERLQVEPALRFKTIAWCFVIIFLSVCYLSQSNPFKLFYPGTVAALPITDDREHLTLYGVEPKSFKIIKVERAISLEGSIAERMQRLALTIQKPIDTQERQRDSAYISLVDLPDFSHAIRKVWFVKESGLLVVDLRDLTLDQELDDFLSNKKVSEDVRQKYLSSYFQAYTASIFMLEPEVKAVEYRLDGQRSARQNMEFNFAARYLAGR